MRVHKKREDTNPHRYFLSELMLYTAYTDEEELGCDDEEKCRKLYLDQKDHRMPFNMLKKHVIPFPTF